MMRQDNYINSNMFKLHLHMSLVGCTMNWRIPSALPNSAFVCVCVICIGGSLTNHHLAVTSCHALQPPCMQGSVVLRLSCSVTVQSQFPTAPSSTPVIGVQAV